MAYSVLKKQICARKHLNAHEVKALSKVFGIGRILNYSLFENGITNNNYYVKTIKGDYVLRQFGKIFKHNDVVFETSLLDFLCGKFISPQLVKTIDGERYFISKGNFICCLKYCKGKGRPSEKKIKSSDLLQLGKTLNEYHFIIKHFKPQGMHSQNDFEKCKDVHFVKKILYPKIEKQLRKKTTKKYALVERFYELMKKHLDDLSQGPIRLHKEIPVQGDLSLGNILFLRNKISAVIDFGASHLNEAIFDLANASLFWSIINSRLDREKLEIFIKGYFSNRKFQMNNMDLLPYIMKWICWGYCNFFLYNFLSRDAPNNVWYSNLLFFNNKLTAINNDEIYHVIDELEY